MFTTASVTVAVLAGAPGDYRALADFGHAAQAQTVASAAALPAIVRDDYTVTSAPSSPYATPPADPSSSQSNYDGASEEEPPPPEWAAIDCVAGEEAIPAGEAGYVCGPADKADPNARTGISTLVGWSGGAIPGLENQVFGTWMARDSWAGMARGYWLYANTGFTAFVAAHPDRAADIGVPLIPHDSGQPLNQLLDEAITGLHDDDYESMGASLGKLGPATVYARLYWEMNMSPYPANSLDRAKFKAAWDRAVPLIRSGFAAAAPSKTLKVVFSPISDGADYRAFYPNSTNVDVIAIDAYASKWGSSAPTAAVLTQTVQTYLDSIAAFAKEQGKPVALGEWGNWQVGRDGDVNSHGLGDFPNYIDQVFDWAAENDAEYVVYFNLRDGGVGQTLADTPLSLARLQARASG
ncbi:hypothetical protein [Naasia sp. SYSU D00057]|uniref:hypothetical protein n=1 Tax=Naasia sp. SYSU D00057 TaxID=2817380 RepID=UPI001B318427|nr:hypothetical protein [Naasia sp. SYSU D00057]